MLKAKGAAVLVQAAVETIARMACSRPDDGKTSETCVCPQCLAKQVLNYLKSNGMVIDIRAKPWTQAELKYLRRYYTTMSNEDISKKLHGRTAQQIGAKGHQLRMRKPKHLLFDINSLAHRKKSQNKIKKREAWKARLETGTQPDKQ